MNKSLRATLSTHALPLLGALGVGALALMMIWKMQNSVQLESYDPAKHDRVRVVTVDQAKVKECLDRQAGAPASEERRRCAESYVYERSQDFYIRKRTPAQP